LESDDEKISQILRYEIFGVLKADAEEDDEKRKEEGKRQKITTEVLLPHSLDKSYRIACLQLSSGNDIQANDYYNNYEMADIYHRLAYKLAYEYKDY
jgi:hypothetical protein